MPQSLFEKSSIQRLYTLLKQQYPQSARFMRDLLTKVEGLYRKTERNRTRSVFSEIYLNNGWGGQESVSGAGSSLSETVVLRRELPNVFRDLSVSSLLDAPCGDHFWMKELPLDFPYIGGDIVRELIYRNRLKYGNPRKTFLVLDITKDRLPNVHTILCRDCLDHLSFQDAFRALSNFRRTGATYLLATTYKDRTQNDDIATGEWRPTNLRLPPFSFPSPLTLIVEECTEDDGLWADKSLGVWKFNDLPF
ncbi:MAG TPA: class I SAM-dependent methyltransferase [Nitrospiraceae bacterium]|nr:class I SAM-dependent methyltransferase [Nitrospiraceae bacterium]